MFKSASNWKKVFLSWKSIRNLQGLFTLSQMPGASEPPCLRQIIQFVKSAAGPAGGSALLTSGASDACGRHTGASKPSMIRGSD